MLDYNSQVFPTTLASNIKNFYTRHLINFKSGREWSLSVIYAREREREREREGTNVTLRRIRCWAHSGLRNGHTIGPFYRQSLSLH